VKPPPENFIGKSYPVKGKGSLTFNKLIGEDERGYFLFSCTCTICSEDKELFPKDFIITREEFSETGHPCMCNRRYRPTEDQLNIINARTLKSVKPSGGFNRNLPATLYLVRWYNGGESYLKFGITNRAVYKRINDQSRNTALNSQIITTFSSESGLEVLELERSIKSAFKTSVCPKEKFPDGYTETIEDTPENVHEILKFFS